MLLFCQNFHDYLLHFFFLYGGVFEGIFLACKLSSDRRVLALLTHSAQLKCSVMNTVKYDYDCIYNMSTYVLYICIYT